MDGDRPAVMGEIEGDPPADPARRAGDEDGTGQAAVSQDLLVIFCSGAETPITSDRNDLK